MIRPVVDVDAHSRGTRGSGAVGTPGNGDRVDGGTRGTTGRNPMIQRCSEVQAKEGWGCWWNLLFLESSAYTYRLHLQKTEACIYTTGLCGLRCVTFFFLLICNAQAPAMEQETGILVEATLD